MRKIIFSLLTIGFVSAIVIGGTASFFSDTEISTGNIFTAGTIDIAVDGKNPWQGTFDWEDIKPGREFEMSFNITNVGENPLKLWKIIKCMQYDDNGVIEPEQEWYDKNGVVEKNDLDSAIVYEMEVDSQMVVSREAGITMDQIKNNYIGLMKLDVGLTTPQYGILEVGESISVTQRYFMKEDTGNWAQSDKMTFVIEIEARQTSAPEPLQQISFMDNKYSNNAWTATPDTVMGVLKYDYLAPTFNYDFLGVGLNSSIEYCLIYYADGGVAGLLIDQGTPNSNGELSLSDYKNINTDLPNEDDDNYPYGAKIWLLPCGEYDVLNNKINGWSPDDNNWLFDNWPGLINYKQGVRPSGEINCDYGNGNGNDNPNCTDNDGDGYFVEASGCENEPEFLGHSDCNDHNSSINPAMSEVCDNGLDDDCDGFVDCTDSDCTADLTCVGVSVQTITLLNLNETNQYGYFYDYSSANVTFTYSSPSPISGKLVGTIAGSNLKPYATYQAKLKGRPVCSIGGADDTANEYIGYKGRWTCVEGIGTCTGNANARNRTDAQYETNKLLQNANSNKECIVGYLVFDYFTADASGNIYADDIILSSDSSYHVLYCGFPGMVYDCSSNTSNDRLRNLDSAHPGVLFCPEYMSSGQPEPGRGGCNGLSLTAGSYDLKMVLTEESFHQGNWATVMGASIEF